ncbi:hypothetical protein V491_00262, partial [Pseudogymnoascus sp. VKM F-3775]
MVVAVLGEGVLVAHVAEGEVEDDSRGVVDGDGDGDGGEKVNARYETSHVLGRAQVGNTVRPHRLSLSPRLSHHSAFQTSLQNAVPNAAGQSALPGALPHMGHLVLHSPPSLLEPLQDASDTRVVPELAGVYPPVYVRFPAAGGAVGYISWPRGVCAVIVALLFEAFFVDETLVDVFDATLLSRHQEALLSPSRTIFPAASNSVKALGPPTEKAVYGPFSFRQIAEFGTIALLLQLVPVLSMFFLLTSAAGSALWAADLEDERQRRLLAAESVVGGAEVNDEFPPEYTDTEDQMHLLVYLGFVLAICGISSAAPAAPAALLQDGHLGKRCSVTTIYVTVIGDPPLSHVKTYGVAHYLVITTLSTCANYITATDLYHYQTQHVGVDGLTTTITTTQTRFETVTISIDVSSVSRSDSLQESTSARFLHDGPSPTEREEHNGMAATTTTFQSLAGTGGARIPTTVSTTSQNRAAASGADGSRVPSLTTNTASQYLTAPTGTAAANDPETVNATSRYLTAPTGTVLPTSQEAVNSTSPTGTQSDIGDDDVVIVTATVYPVKSIAPETSSINTVPVAPTAHDPVSAGMFPYRTGTATTQTIGIVANVSIPGATLPQVTRLAAAAGFANDQTKPLERKDAKLRKHIAAPADSATTTATRSLSTAAPSCGEQGIFRLT